MNEMSLKCLLPLLLLAHWSAPQEKGTLVVSAPPGTEVVWDGVRIGTIPGIGQLTIREIPPGQYRLELRGEGSSRLTELVEVAAATREIALAPKPSPAQPRPAPRTSVAARQRAHEKSSRKPVEPPAENAPQAVPEEAAAPVLPADVLSDERSSRQGASPEGPSWLTLLLASLVGAALLWHLSRRNKLSPEPPPLVAADLLAHRRPPHSNLVREDQASFLEALAGGETARESGVEFMASSDPPVIDIDSRRLDDEES